MLYTKAKLFCSGYALHDARSHTHPPPVHPLSAPLWPFGKALRPMTDLFP
jgi:hypothetical protein